MKNNLGRLETLYHEALEETNNIKSEYEAKLITANDDLTTTKAENEALTEKVDILFKLGRSYLNQTNVTKKNDSMDKKNDDIIEIDDEQTDVNLESLESWTTKKLRGFKRVSPAATAEKQNKTNLSYPDPKKQQSSYNSSSSRMSRASSSSAPSRPSSPTDVQQVQQSEIQRDIYKDKFCHFFVNTGNCTYEERTGKKCKFEHRQAPMCRLGISCRRPKCMFLHPKMRSFSPSSIKPMSLWAINKPMDDSTSEPIHPESVDHAKSEHGAIKHKYMEHSKNREKLSTRMKNKTRRGYGNKNRNKNMGGKQNLTIVGTNSAGLTSKRESFLNIVNTLKPSIITVQETKHTKAKNLKIPGYQNFERIRSGKTGGGLLTCIIDDLNPVLIYTANEDTELMTVEIDLGKEQIRIINGYGPQEHEDTSSILRYWQELEAEVIKAKDCNRNIIIQMDANAKLGSDIIKGDPHSMSNNGKILHDLVERQDLVILNALDICRGSITRERIFEDKSEKSIIDYIIVTRGLLQHLIDMKIDEDTEYVLARYIKTKSGVKVINSDHNVLSCKFSIAINKKPKTIRKEFFKYKCEEGRTNFLEQTSFNKQIYSLLYKYR